MILCSCNVLVAAEIKRVAEEMHTADPDRPVTPRRVFQALGARPQCGSCIEMIRKTLMGWGFAQTCPEPLASSAAEAEEPSKRSRPARWEVV